jgi:hypothetical protein
MSTTNQSPNHPINSIIQSSNHPINSINQLELTAPDDHYYDYCLWSYEPIAPTENKLRSVSLLYHSFITAHAPENAYGLVQAIRQLIGIFNSVWGIKQIGDETRWEYYFYDYKRRARQRSVTKVLEAMEPFISCTVKVNENLPYFMFSLDIDNDLLGGARRLDEIHLYVGNPGSSVSSGICYSITQAASRLENFYFFFDAKKQLGEIANKIGSSVCFDNTAMSLDRILWPALRDCAVIVVANKQYNDTVYFSRVNVDQLIFFMKEMRYPLEQTDFVVKHRNELDHLYFDVGFDYRMEGDDLAILKSGYYGYF